MHSPTFVYRTPCESWAHFAASYLRLHHHREGSRQRMRKYRDRRARAATQARKDSLQDKVERVISGTDEWRCIGCSSHQLRAHLAAQFLPDMGWHNEEEWYVDYIVPRCAFAAQHEQQAFNFSNLRPVWGRFGCPTYTRSHE